jgi:hypothetical protein
LRRWFQNPEPIATRFAFQEINDVKHISTFSGPRNSTPAEIGESATPTLYVEHSVTADELLDALMPDGINAAEATRQTAVTQHFDLTWRRDGAGWVLLCNRRRMGRVLPENQHRGMYRSVLPRGRLSDMANLSWAKSAVLAVAIRELAWEADHPANDPPKCPEKQEGFNGSAPPVRFPADGGLR